MASEKQIAANRRNAERSTGPRSVSGKKRASKNALRHGLSKPLVGPSFIRAAEDLARGIAGDNSDPARLAQARVAAAAMLELDRVRRIEVALIERARAFGRLDRAKIFASKADETIWVALHFLGAQLRKAPPKFADDDLPEMPADEPQRTAEALRRALPALVKLQRYQARTVAKRDQAIRAIALRGGLNPNTTRD
jgi:hypothetical protein